MSPVTCGSCLHWRPDTVGDGQGIGQCTALVVVGEGADRREITAADAELARVVEIALREHARVAELRRQGKKAWPNPTPDPQPACWPDALRECAFHEPVVAASPEVPGQAMRSQTVIAGEINGLGDSRAKSQTVISSEINTMQSAAEQADARAVFAAAGIAVTEHGEVWTLRHGGAAVLYWPRTGTAWSFGKSFTPQPAALARKLVAGRIRMPADADRGRCRGCGATIWWVRTTEGRLCPLEADGMNHFAACPTARLFRHSEETA